MKTKRNIARSGSNANGCQKPNSYHFIHPLILACLLLGAERFTQAAPPRISLQPSSQTVLVLDRVALSAYAFGTEPLGYHWQKDGVPLTDDGRTSGTGTRSLSIAELLPADAGVYSVLVTNAEGSATSSNAVVTVAERLQIRRSAGSMWMDDDGFHLSAATFSGWPHLVLQASEDLRHWGPALTNTAADGLVDFIAPGGGRTVQFYRVQLPDAITLTILYDNYRYAQGTSSDWGFSCLIEGTDKTILFDTGTTASIFLANVAKLGLRLGAVEDVIISHDHGDHTGSLASFLQKNNRVTVWLPYSASAQTKGIVQRAGALLRQEKEAVEVCPKVFLTGEMEGTLGNEQGLILETSQGLVVVVGCSHPGIVPMLERAKQQLNREIYWVIGGFHLIDNQLNDLPRSQILPVIDAVKSLGVKKCSASHCTGALAISLFKEAFGDNYEPAGTGRILAFNAQANIGATNRPPVADAGTNQVVECTGGLSAVVLNGSASHDPDGDPLAYEWQENGELLGTNALQVVSLPLGAHVITLQVTDPGHLSAWATNMVTVVDTEPPALICPPGMVVEFTNETGAVAAFGVAATDACSAVSIVFTPPSGTLLPIGATPVLVQATDCCSNSVQCSFDVTVLGARGVKSNVLAELTALRVGVTNWPDRWGLGEAVRQLSCALATSLWVDQTHVVRRSGHLVFFREEATLWELGELLRRNTSNLPQEKLQGFIDRLVRCDRLLAVVSIQEAAESGVNPKKVAEGFKEVARGDWHAAQGRPWLAVAHYRNAWKSGIAFKVNPAPDPRGGKLDLVEGSAGQENRTTTTGLLTTDHRSTGNSTEGREGNEEEREM